MGNDKRLEKFGEIYISEVRDRSINKFDKIVDGKIKSKMAIELNKKLQMFSKNELVTVKETVLKTIDNVLFNVLNMIEEHEDDIELNLNLEDGSSFKNIRELSDGLCGELLTEDGWIEKYSDHESFQ